MSTTSDSRGSIIDSPKIIPPAPGLPSTSFFGVLFSSSTYRAIFYILMLFPIGIALFTYAVTFGSLSLGLGITIFGLPVAYVFMISLPYLLGFQSAMAEVILGVPMPSVSFHPPSGKFFERLFKLFKDSKVQLGFLSSIFLFPLYVLTFVITVTSLAVSLSLASVVLYPLVRHILYTYGVEFDGTLYIDWLPAGFPEYGLLVPVSVVGILLLILSLHMIRGLAFMHANLIHKITE